MVQPLQGWKFLLGFFHGFYPWLLTLDPFRGPGKAVAYVRTAVGQGPPYGLNEYLPLAMTGRHTWHEAHGRNMS